MQISTIFASVEQLQGVEAPWPINIKGKLFLLVCEDSGGCVECVLRDYNNDGDKDGGETEGDGLRC